MKPCLTDEQAHHLTGTIKDMLPSNVGFVILTFDNSPPVEGEKRTVGLGCNVPMDEAVRVICKFGETAKGLMP